MLWSVAYVGDRNTPSMPPCPCQSTAGTLSIGVFSPCWVTSQTGPTFSVTSMRPSGRNARRQPSLNSATLVIGNGRSGSGFNSPALICAPAVVDTRVSSSPVSSVFIRNLFSHCSGTTSLRRYARPNHSLPNGYTVSHAYGPGARSARARGANMCDQDQYEKDRQEFE